MENAFLRETIPLKRSFPYSICEMLDSNFEMWAMPYKDEVTIQFYEEYKQQLENLGSPKRFVEASLDDAQSYATIFVPGGHGEEISLMTSL